MKSQQINLTYSCSENWDKMTPKDQGRHCASCDKIVKDFTQWSDQQIMDYLMSHSNTCGKVYEDQLDRPMHYMVKRKRNWTWGAVAAMLIAGAFQILPSTGYAQQNQMGQQQPIQLGTFKGGHLPQQNTETVITKDTEKEVQVTFEFYDKENNEPINYAYLYNEAFGQLASQESSKIKVDFSLADLPDVIKLNLSAHNYRYIEYTIDKKSIENMKEATFKIYLEYRPMKMGKIAVHD